MILIIDNYDSFTYNIVQQVGSLVDSLEVAKNNKTSISKIERKNYSHIIISPGPGSPKDAGSSINIIHHFYKKMPILGVCLGHQAIGEAFNYKVKKHSSVFHGKTSQIYQKEASRIYKGLPNKFEATRYHSLTVEPNSVPDVLEVTAQTKDGVIMGLAHKKHPIHGVQFHPESIASEFGHAVLANFLTIAGVKPTKLPSD